MARFPVDRFPASSRSSRSFLLSASAIACSIFCLACSQTSAADQSSDIKALVKQSLADMVYVKGGTFMMGDFGPSVSKDKLPYTTQHEDKPAHQVTLDGFSIARHKVTYAEFDVYMNAASKLRFPDDPVSKQYQVPTHPAGVPWQAAKDYCQWLGKQSGQPIDLPTEAQWEYAARSGGKPVLFATDNGKWEPDRNFPSADTIDKKLSPGLGVSQKFVYPVGKYPPNPLGLYDMGFNGRDWVNDWFDPDWYAHSPDRNPQGPASGTKKVLRGFEGGYDESAMTFYRAGETPTWGDPDLGGFPAATFRCAIESTKPL